MARIKYYNNETGKWEYADSAFSGGNVDNTVPDSGQNGNGLSTTAANLLIEILENAVYSTNVSSKIASLKDTLASGGSSGGDTGGDEPVVPDPPDEPDEPVVVDDITISDGVMTIVSVGSAITVSDGVMTIA